MSASGSQGSFPTHASHLRAPRLFEPKFLKGAQPSLVRNLRGPASLWHFRKSRVAETEGPEAIRKWGGGSCHNPGASRSPLRTLPSHPARVAGFHGGGRARGLAWGRGRASQETEGPAGQRVQGHSDPEHQEIILYNHLKQRYFLKSLNYFQLFGDDPAFFFSPQTSCQ